MPKSLSERSASYRARQREKVERYEAALREINTYVEYSFDGTVCAPQALDAIGDFARGALNPPALHIEV